MSKYNYAEKCIIFIFKGPAHIVMIMIYCFRYLPLNLISSFQLYQYKCFEHHSCDFKSHFINRQNTVIIWTLCKKNNILNRIVILKLQTATWASQYCQHMWLFLIHTVIIIFYLIINVSIKAWCRFLGPFLPFLRWYIHTYTCTCDVFSTGNHENLNPSEINVIWICYSFASFAFCSSA